MAGLAEVPSVSGAVATGSRRLAPSAVRMFRSKSGTSSGTALLNTAAEIAADVNLAAGPGKCFPEDTPVFTPRGETPIQDIRVGDRVWSYDERRQRREPNPVTRTHRSRSEELITIALEDDEIRATPGHPFWIDRRGWIRAESLQAGDTLRAIDGRPLKVEQATVERKPGDVYNFEVRGAHTYYASTSAVLVHNTNCASNAAIIVRKIVGKPATQMEYGGEAQGLVVSYNHYKKLRRIEPRCLG